MFGHMHGQAINIIAENIANDALQRFDCFMQFAMIFQRLFVRHFESTNITSQFIMLSSFVLQFEMRKK